jgi:diacylglycerol kinase family enzyme
VRALLIVNPRATSTTRLRRDVIASALKSAVQLDVEQTRYRGHAALLAASARAAGYGLVLTLGGDGTVNEVVNGILRQGTELTGQSPGLTGQSPGPTGRAPGPAGQAPGPAGQAPPADQLPAIAALPGGSANVFTGALRMPRDPVDAAGQILQALAERRERTIGLGLADDRYFTFNSGFGLDAEVVRAVQGLRAHGRHSSPALYVRTALRQFYQQTDRRRPAVMIELPGHRSDGPVFLGIISNTAPWTYLGTREVNASPRASFDTGLDVLAMRTLSSLATITTIGQMLLAKAGQLQPGGRNALTYHDQKLVILRANRPVAFQIDGEYVGEREHVTFRAVPDALRVVV